MSDGSRHSLRIVAEVTPGTTPATPAFTPIRHTSTTLGMTKDPLESAELRDDRQISTYRHGARQCNGDIGFEFSYGSFDNILEAVLGGTWTANVLTAGVVRRTFTIERFFSDLLAAANPYHRFTGCEFNTLALQINANAMITGTVGILGLDMVLAQTAIAGATVAAPTTTDPLDSFTGELKEGGVTIAVITEIQLNVDNGMAARFVVGSKTSIKPSQGRSRITGQITAYFENSDLFLKFVNEVESSIEVNLPDLDGNNYKLELPRVKYNGGKPDVTGDGPITLAMPFIALLDPVTNTNCKLTREPA